MFERVIEQAMNRVLSMDPVTAERLGEFSGKCVEVRIDGIPRSLVIEFDATAMVFVQSLSPADVQDADAVLAGSAFAFARAAVGNATGAPAAMGLRFEGDIGLAQGVSTVLKELDIDFEDELARTIGDAPAHQLGRLFRDVQNAFMDTRNRARDNVAEFLREESGQTVYPEELEAFLDDVDAIRSDVEQIDRRIAVLSRQGDQL